MKKLLAIVTSLILVIPLFGQPGRRVPPIDTVRLWLNGAPNAFEIPGPESGFLTFRAKAYEDAMMEVYPAKNPNGLCVIMCPGGAYIMESQTHEGRDLKDWFNARGITYCMLQYRLPCGHHDVPLSDVQQAIRIMRKKAPELGITKIGIAGNSAGGHLAACAATLFDSPETRPDFQILMYPVITMEESFTNKLSRDALLGKTPSGELVDRYSCEKHVTGETPPAFIVLCSDDTDVPPANSLRYYEQLIANKVSATMHIYPAGGHGWGWKDSMLYKDNWVSEMEKWLFTVVAKLN
ncbi:MAG: alpha/beta hydrolase [Synergistaceae bacterium]|jgi:acetyl esterase/lipase|nr:alpha/beta hydrolase [Bacteroidales bacterium]